MEICILGMIENLIPTAAERTLVGLFLCQESCCTALEEAGPPFHPLLEKFNNSLPLYKYTYANRGCPKKYDRVW